MNRALASIALLALASVGARADGLYAPARQPTETDAVGRIVLRDNERQKNLELRVTFPEQAAAQPVIIFSHGATGSKDGYQPLAQYWAAYGYVVIQPTHLDSRKYGGRLEDRATIAKAWKDRCEDIAFIIDSLGTIDERLPGAAARINRDQIAVGGHSYGALTSQMVAGLTYELPRGQRISFADGRSRCFVIISPQGTGQFLDAESYRDMKRPMLMITGDEDGTPYGEGKGAWRREAFDNAPPGQAWLMWIKDAHHGFGGIAGPIRYPRAGRADPDQVRWVAGTSLAFLDAQLRGDAAAADWLGSGDLADATDGKATLEHKTE